MQNEKGDHSEHGEHIENTIKEENLKKKRTKDGVELREREGKHGWR